jgi:hypothetical protein
MQTYSVVAKQHLSPRQGAISLALLVESRMPISRLRQKRDLPNSVKLGTTTYRVQPRAIAVRFKPAACGNFVTRLDGTKAEQKIRPEIQTIEKLAIPA